jgi:hypothetical protein
MIFKFKKAIISSLLATIVIFGAVAPMASAAGGSIRVDGYVPNFNNYSYGAYADSESGSIRVQYLDSDTSKVVLYDANGIEAGSAVNANPVISNQITTGETLLSVEFKDVTPGLYTIREFAGTVRSAASYVITLNPKDPESTFGWDPTALGTVQVTNLTPGAVVTLFNPYVQGEVPIQPTQIADANGIANFTGVPNGSWYRVKQTFVALGGTSLTSYSNSDKYLAKNNLPSMEIETNAQGDVTVSNVIPAAELRLYHVSITTSGSTSVTSDVYLSAVVPASGTFTFPAAATVAQRYRVIETTNDGNDRVNSFVIEPHAPTLALTTTGTGASHYRSGTKRLASLLTAAPLGYNDYSTNADESGTLTFDRVPAGIYVQLRQAAPFNPCSYGDNSNEIVSYKNG